MSELKSIFTDFSNQLSETIKLDITSLLAKNADKHIYAVNLVTDGDFGSLYLAMSSAEGLKNKAAERNPKTLFEMSCLAWFLEDINIDELGANSRVTQLSDGFLYEKMGEFQEKYIAKYGRDDHWDYFADDFIECLCTALKNADLGGLIGNSVYMAVGRPEHDSWKLENQSSALVNTPELHALFLQREEIVFPFYPKKV